MSFDLFREIIDQAEGNIEFISLASRGEPLLCPDIKKMLAYTEGKVLNLKLNTNASLLSEKMAHAILSSGVKTLVFSVDAADATNYRWYRVNGNFDRVLNNIKTFREIREKHYSGSEIVTRVSGVKYSDAQEIASMKQVWGPLVDQVAFVDCIPWTNIYDEEANQLNAPCSDLWRRMFVWWDGRVNPCDVDYKTTLSVGNLRDSSISDMWCGKEYTVLRERHLSSHRYDIYPCCQCSFV